MGKSIAMLAAIMVVLCAAPAMANPLVAQLETAVSTTTDPVMAQRLRLNIERARALPTVFPSRYIWVDIPAQMLWLYEDGKVVLSMPVVVGKPSDPTPTMVTTVDAAIFNPYWNLPWDLVRDHWGRMVLKNGPSYLSKMNMEVLSDWTTQARVIRPETVNWNDVVAGTVKLRVRQRPGNGNMLGSVKFDLNNSQGIYLHDTPFKGKFRQTVRASSSGCIRLADAPALARALVGSIPPSPTALELRTKLAAPVPVFITYLTVQPGPNGLTILPDIYGLDAPGNPSLTVANK